jgi:hypothetical protein
VSDPAQRFPGEISAVIFGAVQVRLVEIGGLRQPFAGHSALFADLPDRLAEVGLIGN